MELKKSWKKKDAIIKRVEAKSPISKKSFEFLFEALEYIKSSGEMDKALQGALKNGCQAEELAFEIIKYAISKRKVSDAKGALEVLAVMHYDTLSSAHWEKFKGAQGAILGDKDFSFNKNNEAMSVITNAIDKTFYTGINGLFWLGVMTRNLIQHGRGKMSPDNLGRMSSVPDKINADGDEIKNLESARAEHLDIRARLNTAQDGFGYALLLRRERDALNPEIARLNAAVERGAAKATDSKPYNAPNSDFVNMQMLMSFWNAVNGFTCGINVNSYNVFRNIKTVRKGANLSNIFNQNFSQQGV